MTFNDLIQLARLCLKRAVATSNPVAAVQLRRMADDYQARADALDEARTPNIAPIPESYPPAAQPLQQQQPQRSRLESPRTLPRAEAASED
jgi:hypothetical protein